MGYYIEVPRPKGKAQQLADLHGATILPQRPEAFEDVPDNLAIICVVDNGPFEAAAFCYCREEFVDFADTDHGDRRPRQWVLMDKALARQLAGFIPR